MGLLHRQSTSEVSFIQYIEGGADMRNNLWTVYDQIYYYTVLKYLSSVVLSYSILCFGPNSASQTVKVSGLSKFNGVVGTRPGEYTHPEGVGLI